MTINASASQIQSVFVTGATGLLENNLVRLLVSRGVQVKALVRSREKAEKQFADLPVEYVMGDMTNAGWGRKVHQQKRKRPYMVTTFKTIFNIMPI